MIITNGGGYYPSHYGSTPFTGLSNTYGIGHPSIPPYYNPPFQPQLQQQQSQPTNPQPNENISSFKLYDFDTSNHSDIIRLIFSYADISYKDKHVKEDEWNKIKEKVPFEQLPILRVNNQYKIYHLHAIICHLAREFYLYGTSKQDHTIVDIIVETIRPLQEKIFAQLENSTDYEQTLRQLITDHSTIYLKQLENFYEIFNCHGPFYLGSYISLADLIVYDTINYLIKIEPKLLENFPYLKEARRRLEKHPRLSNYLNTKIHHQRKKSRQKTSSPPRHQTKSPTPNVTFEQHQHHHHHRHRSHDGHKSSHHHHCRHHRHHRTQSKEPTPLSHTKEPTLLSHTKEPTPLPQTKQQSIRSSKSPSISKKTKESTPLKSTNVMPPPPPPPPPVTVEDKSESTIN